MIYFGIVEDRLDDLKIGRCRVRIAGIHSPDPTELPTSDLPWAKPILPITSASVSGVGHAPVGLVEGSLVMVVFADEDKQQPYIIGSLAGIPADSPESIQLFLDNALVHKTVEQINTYTSETIRLITSYSTYKESAISTDNGYVIGYKSYSIDGIPVSSGLRITRDIADKELKIELDSILSQLRNKIRAPITQSMMDSLVSIVHDIGFINLLSSPVISELNTGKYESAASQIQMLSGDRKRRSVEKTLFLKDGIPSNEISPSVIEERAIKNNAFNDPVGDYPLYKNEPDTHKLARNEDIGSTVVAFKEAAKLENVPIAGDDGATWSQSPVPYAAQYPHNKVYASESGHIMEFDDTKGAERVHIYHRAGTYSEIDANGTRVNRIVGDNYEILERNGFVYVRGAQNVTVEGSHNLKVAGVCNIDIAGATNINIGNDANINVSGSVNLSVGENLFAKAPTMKFDADNFDLSVSGSLKIKSGDAHIKSDNVFIDGNALNLKGVTTKLEGSGTIDLKGGALILGYSSAIAKPGAGASADAASEASESGLTAPSSRGTANNPQFSELHVVQRQDNGNYAYETPDEGSEEEVQAYINQRVSSGEVKKESVKPVSDVEVKKAIEKEPPKTIPKNTLTPPSPSCDIIFGMKDIPMSLQLSKYYTLRDMTANGTRPLKTQNGLSPQQLACNLKNVCVNLDKIKEEFPNIFITSGWRRPQDAKGSSPNSQHNKGQAVDIQLRGFSKKQVYDAIHRIAEIVPYDQLILEYLGSNTIWIHYSVVYSGNRRQTFTMKNHRRVSNFGKFVLL